MKFTLRPVNHGTNFNPKYDQVLMLDRGYPMALIHIDYFFKTHEIYKRLDQGEEVVVEAELRIVEEE